MLTAEQKRHWDTFGFLMLRQVLALDEVNALREATIKVIKQVEAGALSGEKEWAIGAFWERHPLLTSLIDDERIHQIPESLLGPDFFLLLTDGHVRVGDTDWHGRRGSHESPTSTHLPTVKVAIYFESLKKENGCLCVIPGSQRRPYADNLEPLWRQQDDPSNMTFGFAGKDIPCVPLESEPGDVVVFTESVYHASFGSKTPRLLITAQYGANPTTEDQVANIRECHKEHTWSYHPAEAFVNSDRPRIRRMVAKLLELGMPPLKI